MYKQIKSFENFNKKLTLKKHICIHTTGSRNVDGSINHWKTRAGGKGSVSTPYIIGTDGMVYQTYNPQYWSHHTGLGDIDKNIIGIEIANAGVMTMKDNILYNDLGVKTKNYITTVLTNNEQAYHDLITDAQIISLGKLLKQLTDIFMIDKEIYSNTKDGSPFDYGIFTHQHINSSKSDIPDWVMNKIIGKWHQMNFTI